MLKQIAKFWPKNMILRILSGVGLLVLVLFVAVYITAQTPWAKDRAKSALEAALSGQSVAKLSLSNLGGFGLGHLSVDELTISDPAGAWLQAKDLTIRWHPLALLLGKADISEISLAEITALRRPQPAETTEPEPSDPSGSGGLPDLPVSITVDKLSIARMHLQPLSDAPLDDLVATASGKWHSDNIALELDIHALNTDQYVLLAEISLDPDSYELTAKINGKEGAGGSLAKRFDLGPNGPLLADIDVAGRIPELVGRIRLSTGAQSLADVTFAEVTPAKSDEAASRMTGTIAVPDPQTRTWHPLDVGATLSLRKDRVIAFSNTSLKDGGFTVSTSGQLDLDAQEFDAAYSLSGAAGPIVKAFSGADFASAGGKGTARRSNGNLTVDAALNFRNVQRGPIAADTLDMVAKLALDEMGTDRQSLALTADGTMAAKPAQTRRMDALFEEPLTFSAAISQKPGTKQIVIEKCDITHPVVTATVNGSVGSATAAATPDKPLEIAANLNVADLDALGELLALPVSGDRLTAKVTVSGDTSDPSAEFTASSGTMIYRGRTFDDLEASGRIVHATTSPDGTFTVTAQTSGQPLTIDATVAPAETGPARLVSDLKLRAPQTTATGSIALDDGFFPLSANLRADFADLSLWSWVLEQDLAGALVVDAKLTPSDTGPAILNADVNGKNIVYGTTFEADRLTLRTSGPMDKTIIDQDLELTAQTLRTGNTDLDRLRLTAQGGPDDVTANLTATGRHPRPFDLSAQATTQVPTAATPATTETIRTTQIAALKWTVDDDVWTLAKPATLTTSPGTTVLDALHLKSKKGGNLRAELKLAPTTRSANLSLDKLPLSLATFADPSLDFVGWIEGSASLSANGDTATAKADFDLERVATRRMGNARPVDGELSARLSGNRLTATLSLDSGPAGTLKATAASPVTYTAQGGFSAPPNGKLTAAIDGSADLGAIWSLSGVPSQTLVGAVTADVDISGTLAKPVARGTLNIADAEYQHLEYGILLTKMNIDGAINNKRIELKQFTASDGGEGMIDVNGHITLDPAAGMPAEFTADIDKAMLVQRADVLARLSGDIVYKSAASKKSITGDITVDQMDIQIPDQLPVSITELEVKEIGTRTSAKAVTGQETAKEPKTPTRLEVDIDIPNRTYVRGRGLDSQWAGALKVRGSLSQPEISGDLNTVRGTMALVGESFNITKGNIEFLGGSTVNPQMDIVAAHERNDITTKVTLSGRARNPKVALSSVPPLPDNEILSQLLYGRSSASLSTVEALQLANSVRTLTGGGGGSLLGKARSALGLDVLTVEGGEGGTGPTVSGGKHLSDRVYVEVGKGATSAGDSVGVQIEITDQISLETDLSTQAGTNVGVKWEHDY